LHLSEGRSAWRDGSAKVAICAWMADSVLFSNPVVGVSTLFIALVAACKKPPPVAEPRKAITPAEFSRSVDIMFNGYRSACH